jgi:GT2 family glycosyltransferase
MTTLPDDTDAPENGGPAPDEQSFFGPDEPGEPVGPDLRTFDRHLVTAVLVVHDGMRWLPYTLAAMQRLALPPHRLVAVDTGSTDGSTGLLEETLGAPSVITLPRDTGFGASVAHAVDALRGAPGTPSPPGEGGPTVEWVWLLHDDCAPEPETLRRLLAVVDSSPSIAVAGPKVRGWHDSSRLLEVGVSVGGGGRRQTGLDRGELDQGQHDDRRDVLAVGSAGLLVRQDVWDDLAGFDPRLPLFRDDVDFGWRTNLAGHRVVVVPDAVVHHVEAAAHGRRDADAARLRVHRADRRAAVHVLLANCPAYSLPWHWLRLAVGTILRTLGLVVGKAPSQAWDELSGAGVVLLGPLSLARARRSRRRTRTVPARSVRHLLPSPVAGLRQGAEGVASLLSGRTDLAASAGSALDSGPTSEDADYLASGSGRLRELLSRPGVQLTLGLLLVALVAFRGLLVGDGVLQGGALLPTSSASALWRAYTAGWHDVGVGSATPAVPYLVPMAAFGFLLVGKAWLAVDLVLLLAAPLAGLVAYRLLARVAPQRPVRLLAAGAYALLPAVTGAVAGGRIDVAVASWLLPLVLWVAGAAVGVGGGSGSMRRAWVAGLLLAVLVAFLPISWLLVALVGVGCVLLWAPASTGMWVRLLAVLVVPPIVLVPWTAHVLSDPSQLLLGAGAPTASLASRSLPAWHVAVANPGGPGVPPAWVTVPLLIAGLAALLRPDRRRAVATAWVVVLAGLVVGLAVTGRTVTPRSLGTQVPLWPGPATLLVGGGLLAAAALGAEGASLRLRAQHFGWRQPAAVLLAVVTAAVPVLLALSWLNRGASSVLARRDTEVLPAYVQAASAVTDRPRALVLQLQRGVVVAYALVPGEGRQLGDAEVAPPASRTAGVATVLERLLAGTAGTADVQVLASYGTGFVVLDAPVEPAIAARLDGTPGLARVSSVASGAVWQLVPPGARVQLVQPPDPPVPVPADPGSRTTSVDTAVPPRPAPGRSATLRLAESAAAGWTATGDGRQLARHVADGWAQAFDLPPGVLAVTVRYTDRRTSWLVAEAIAVLAVVVLALPARRRRGLTPDDDDSDELGAGAAGTTAGPAVGAPAALADAVGSAAEATVEAAR